LQINLKVMVYFKIKENSTQAKLMIEYLKSLSFVELIAPEDIPNQETKKAIKDARQGKVNKYKNSEELFSKLKKMVNVQN
jgi:hypothetical protein